MLELVKRQQPVGVSVLDGGRSNHFRIQKPMPEYQSQQIATMPVSPIHHRRYAEPAVNFHRASCTVRWFLLGNPATRPDCRALSGVGAPDLLPANSSVC